MIFELVLGVLSSLQGQRLYELVFVLLFLCGTGAPLSQDLVLLGAAGLTLIGNLQPVPLVVVAAAGLLLGDLFTFWVGHHWGAAWVRRPWAARFVPPDRLPAMERAASRHAFASSIVTRFLPGQRSTLFFVAGTLRMPYRPFLLGDGLAALVHAGGITYGVRALGWRWTTLRAPLARADDVLTGVLVLLAVALWMRARRRMLPVTAGRDVPASAEARMELSSSSIVGGKIAKAHACSAKGGSDQPPQLTVREIPSNAKFLAIVADDPDAMKPTGQVWVHWNVFNIPSGGHTLEVAAGQPVPGGEVGQTSGGSRGYEGMCPPDGVHTYRFAVFALQDRIRIDANQPWTIDAFEAAHGSQVVGKAVITGQF